MGLFDFLTSAVGGSILGGITHLLGVFAGEAKEWSASKRRIAEIQAMKERDIAVGELQAFSKAVEGTLQTSYQPPTNAPMWMHGILCIVEAMTRVVRPLMVGGACWYVWSLPQDVLGPLRPEILTVSFACIYFWLGTRLQRQISVR